MQDDFLRIFTKWVIALAGLNLIFLPFTYSESLAIFAILLIGSLIELGLFITSIVATVYVIRYRLEKRYWFLPLFYLIGWVLFFGYGVYSSFSLLQSTRSFEIPMPVLVVSGVWYFVQIIAGFKVLNSEMKIVPRKSTGAKHSVLGVISIVLGGISFIPGLGILFGFGAIVLGIIDIKKSKNKFALIGVVLGILGILFSILLYGSIFYFIYRGGGPFEEIGVQVVKERLPSAAYMIESYKARYGEYPESLEVFDDSTPFFDHIAVMKFRQFSGDPLFYYERKDGHYYLFSMGVDRVPFTSDDILPEFKGDPGNIGLIREEPVGTLADGSGTHALLMTDVIGVNVLGNSTRTYTLNGVAYDVVLVKTGGDHTWAVLRINGQTTVPMREGEVFLLPHGFYIRINRVYNAGTVDISFLELKGAG